MGVLSAVDVVAEGVALARERGLDSLSLRNVASRLGVTPMALYRHVPDAESLQREVVRRLAALLPAPGDSYRAWAMAARDELVMTPGLARHLMVQWFAVPEALDIVEGLLRAAERGGRHGFAAVAVANAVFTFVLMRVELEGAIRSSGVVHRRVARAPVSRPLLTAHASYYEVAQLDAHFSFGLDALLRGLDAT